MTTTITNTETQHQMEHLVKPGGQYRRNRYGTSYNSPADDPEVYDYLVVLYNNYTP